MNIATFRDLKQHESRGIGHEKHIEHGPHVLQVDLDEVGHREWPF